MAKYRNSLPQLAGGIFIADGGLETTLIFHEGVELPYFAAFNLLRTDEGTARIVSYKERFIALARSARTGLVLHGGTWRASPDWGLKLGYSLEELANINRRSVELMVSLRRRHETPRTPIVLSAVVGPRGDGYQVGGAMSATEAQRYHSFQIDVFAQTEADLVSAFTLTYADEAIGVVRAAKAAGLPSVISFTVETDGKLPSGQALKDAIEQCDRETAGGPAYYMINCAHPSHFEAELKKGGAWLKRLRGLAANASRRSHAELDASPELDIGNPVELGQDYRRLLGLLPHLAVLGGCCGTDHRHVEQICTACLPAEAA
jgi:homocysteine S-methyltransferase